MSNVNAVVRLIAATRRDEGTALFGEFSQIAQTERAWDENNPMGLLYEMMQPGAHVNA